MGLIRSRTIQLTVYMAVDKMEATRKCRLCRVDKFMSLFYHNNCYDDGYDTRCKTCVNTYNKEWERTHIKQVRASQARSRSRRQSYIINYRKTHRKKINKQSHECHKRRLLSDINYKIGKRLSKRFREALKKNRRAGKMIELLGCSLQEFRDKMENLFEPCMSWQNYGYETWHIHHIKAIATFDLTDLEQQKVCFHWTNLMPLWGKENIGLGAKETPPEKLIKLERAA